MNTNNADAPFLLLAWAAIYLVSGFGSILKSIVTSDPQFLVGAISIAIAYGIFFRKLWSLFLLKFFVILQAIAVIPIIVIQLISDESKSEISFFDFAIEINPKLGLSIIVCIIVVQVSISFSESTKIYFHKK